MRCSPTTFWNSWWGMRAVQRHLRACPHPTASAGATVLVFLLAVLTRYLKLLVHFGDLKKTLAVKLTVRVSTVSRLLASSSKSLGNRISCCCDTDHSKAERQA